MRLKPNTAGFYLGIIAVLLFVITAIVVHFRNSGKCQGFTPAVFPVNRWTLQPSDIDAQLVMQVAENLEASDDIFGGTAIYGLALSENHAIYRRYGSYCDPYGGISAIDIQSSSLDWSLNTDAVVEGFRSVYALDDGYLVITYNYATRIGSSGAKRWDAYFQRRTLSTQHQEDDALYLRVSPDSVHVLSNVDGSRLSTFANVVNRWRDIALVQVDKNTARLVNNTTQDVLISDIEIPTLDSPVATRSGDFLLIYDWQYDYPRELSITVYNIAEGRHLYRLDNLPFYGFPTIIDSKIVLYTGSELDFYELSTGNQVGELRMQRDSQQDESIREVWLSSYEDTIALHFRQTYETLVIKLNTQSANQ